MKIPLRGALAAAALAAAAALVPPALAAAPLGQDLPGLLEFARAQNPELAAMRLEAEAAGLRVQPAAALPDPVLRIELEDIGNSRSRAGPNLLPSKVGETRYTLMQSLPLWGKRDLLRDVAAADARQAAFRTTAAWNDLAARIKAGFARHYLAAGKERLTLEVLDLVTRLEQLAQARYAGGLVAQQDAIRAQLEQTALRAELIAIDADKRQAQVRLNALLGRDPAAPLAAPGALRPLPEVSVLDAAGLAQRARQANPALAAEEARLRSTEASRELTRRNRYPDIQVGVSPTQMGSRITAWGLMVEMNIPLQRESRRAREHEAESLVQAQRARSQSASSQLLGELGENLAAFEAARRSDALLGGPGLVQAELGFRSALAAYENGKVDFATLLDAQRQIRKARLDRLGAQVEAQLRLADIERLVGEDL
jgi:outer membrane protein, heavy metal efflux system